MFSQTEKMDRMYRYQRHIYDLTRAYYLLGRDRLLERMTIRPGDRVLEVGCGTARNLIRLAQKYPLTFFYGIDASEVMLATARTNIERAGLVDNIELQPCCAEDLHHRATFHLPLPFDAIFFSYSLSMIPTWQPALEKALENLKPGKTLSIVDFWDQRGLPIWFRRVLTQWLGLFGVHHKPELLSFLAELQHAQEGAFAVESVARGYAFLAFFQKQPAPEFIIRA
ncbi:MAG: class I SAM-dependent methyltransferase [Blastocatellia bacterium]|nr:class I SAM-dependent methyltransferase [Blastocatellia bacterium]